MQLSSASGGCDDGRSMFDPTPSVASMALFALGWIAGWLLLWRERPLPARSAEHGAPGRDAVAVVVPARDEAATIGPLVAAVRDQLRELGDELVVVDDQSSDRTRALAAAAGARVASSGPLPAGWLGKPRACSVGASTTSAPILVFLDADVTPAPDLIDRLRGALALHPDALVSVQPWHRTGGRPYEQLSLFFNITAVMGSLGFSAFGARGARQSHLAFGPVLAVRRTTYERAGGHGHPAVRVAVAEDIALAHRIGAVELYTGRPDTTFRMYPDGVRSLVQGWTKNIATGAAHVRWWFSLFVIAWIWSLCGGWLASPWFYGASAVQVGVLARRVGRFHVVTVAAYPIAVAAFLVVFLRSVAVTALRRDVRWKGRRFTAR
jgi:4,4'-diaponeurosporenoate glycosyltransferase